MCFSQGIEPDDVKIALRTVLTCAAVTALGVGSAESLTPAVMEMALDVPLPVGTVLAAVAELLEVGDVTLTTPAALSDVARALLHQPSLTCR